MNEYGILSANPFVLVKLGSVRRQVPEFLFYDELDALFDSIDIETAAGLRDRAMFELIYACGLRVSEAAALKISDLDFSECIVHILGKGNKERVVPFHDVAKEFLLRYLREVRPLWCADDHAFVFVNQHGRAADKPRYSIHFGSDSQKKRPDAASSPAYAASFIRNAHAG